MLRMGTLADIYSYANTLKRKVGDLASDPLGVVRQKMSQYVEDQDAQNNLQANAFPMAGDRTVLNSPEQMAGFRAKLADQASGQAFAGIFGGFNARTAPKHTAMAASRRLKAGDDPAQVWKETGWGRGPDGELRFEISDDMAKFNDAVDIRGMYKQELERANAIKQQATDAAATKKVQTDLFPKQLNAAITETRGQAKSVRAAADDWANGGLAASPDLQGNRASIAYDHPDLYAAYPELASNMVQQGGYQGPGAMGQRSGTNISIYKPALAKDPASTMAHEMQHGVQDAENFARGGNQEAFMRADSAFNQPLQDQLKAIGRQPWSPDVGAQATTVNRELSRRMGNPFEAYQRLGGEAEARLTQARLSMSPSQRANSYPFDPDYFKSSTGVGFDDLIHTDSQGSPMAAGALTQAITQ